jgi:hypothetical protein
MNDCKIKYITIQRGEGAEDLKLSLDEARKLYHELDKLFGSEYSMATQNPVYKGEMYKPLSPGWHPSHRPIPHCEEVKFKQPYGSE